ncbi:hypothetical protein DK853_42545, partial [Klebsiella oxytoca]
TVLVYARQKQIKRLPLIRASMRQNQINFTKLLYIFQNTLSPLFWYLLILKPMVSTLQTIPLIYTICTTKHKRL